jgi:hypothetical protein
MISQSFSSALLERLIQVSSLFNDQKRGGAKRNCSEAECVGADLSFCSFPQKWKGKELQSEFPNQIIQVQTKKWVT